MPGSDPQPPDDRRGGFWAFWTTLPGILTGCAALLTAIGGLLALQDRSPAARGDPPVDSAAPASASATREGSATQPDASTGIFAQGRLTMKSPDDADLEQGVVGTSPPGYDLYLHCSGIECILNGMRSLMTVADGASDRSSCIEALRARRDQALYLSRLREGQKVCIQTEEGHVGFLEILELPGVGSIDFVFSYTLWQ